RQNLSAKQSLLQCWGWPSRALHSYTSYRNRHCWRIRLRWGKIRQDKSDRCRLNSAPVTCGTQESPCILAGFLDLYQLNVVVNEHRQVTGERLHLIASRVLHLRSNAVGHHSEIRPPAITFI